MEFDQEGESFDEVSRFVQEVVTSGRNLFPDNQKLKLYGLFKQATCGEITTSQPSIFHPKERAKWASWKSHSGLSQREAKEQYVAIVSELCPDWQGTKHQTFGPVFSRFEKKDDDSEEDISPSKELFMALVRCRSQQEMEHLLKEREIVEDDSRRNALHWAADEGYLQIAEVLVRSGVDVNSRDIDGMTPLHYAVLCQYKELAYKLAEIGAQWDLKDASGETARDLLPSEWTINAA